MFANKSKKIQKRMKRNYCLLLVLFAVLEGMIPGTVSAASHSDALNPQETWQTRRITGTVVDSKGEPIIGASVLVKGTNIGVITDVNGDFTLNASQGSIFTISYVGYTPQEAFIGTASSYRIVLVDDALALSEVVVTAMGIKKEKKALGYSVQDIRSDELLKNKTANPINSLSGKIAGVNVTQTSGAAGSGAQVILRGGTSLERDNQPLFVVDGIIYDNSTSVNGNSAFDGLGSTASTNSNRVMDINPEDIENMSVLKGPAAAALYGSRAAAGVIIITTKKGQEGTIQVNVGSKFTTGWINRLPEQQNLYKRGYYDTRGVFDDYTTQSWGEKFGAGEKLYDNVSDFFQGSSIWDHNVSVAGGTKNGTFYVSASRFDQMGIIPTTGYDKTTFRINGDQKYGQLTVGANIAYSQANTDKTLTSAGLWDSGGTGTMNSVYRGVRHLLMIMVFMLILSSNLNGTWFSLLFMLPLSLFVYLILIYFSIHVLMPKLMMRNRMPAYLMSVTLSALVIAIPMQLTYFKGIADSNGWYNEQFTFSAWHFSAWMQVLYTITNTIKISFPMI
ncbi:TonB-dependent receptor SusC, partial [termite gut metagenome]